MRRTAGGLAAAGLGVGCEATDEPAPTAAGTGPWGGASDARQSSAFLPEGTAPEGVLELFLWGGVNALDTFHVIPEHGDPAAGGPHAGKGWWVYQEGENNFEEVFRTCGVGDRPLLQPWRTDSEGRQVQLGPFIYPFRERPDLLARTRSLVMRHDAAPHQVAVPLALGGHVNGNPRLAGFGAHVERFFQERQGLRDAPYAWVLIPERIDTDSHNTDAAVAVGAHPASSRPLGLRFGETSRLVDLLTRSNLGARSNEVDAALAYYLDRRRSRYAFNGRSVRAPALDGYDSSLAGLRRAGSLRDILPPELLAVTSNVSCGQEGPLDLSTTQLRLATHLLTRASEPAKYVCMIDGGLLPASQGAVYDTHSNHVVESSRNLIHVFRELVRHINEPGENDPDKLDLDRHQIVITTEFGRSPHSQDETGLNHWPWGYVQLVLGGWADEERSGIVGSIPESAYADDWISPAEFRAGMLLGMGIWPFNREAFGVGDTRIDGDEADAAHWLRERVLGYPT